MMGVSVAIVLGLVGMSLAVWAPEDDEVAFEGPDGGFEGPDIRFVVRMAGQLFVLFLCGMLVAAAIVRAADLDVGASGGELAPSTSADAPPPGG
jgi:hypothetical protein